MKLYRYIRQDAGSILECGKNGKPLHLSRYKWDAEKGKEIPLAYPETWFDPEWVPRLIEEGVIAPVS